VDLSDHGRVMSDSNLHRTLLWPDVPFELMVGRGSEGSCTVQPHSQTQGR
jgi:hypothetical protein